MPSYRISTGLFIRSVGATFALAFISLWCQVEGLYGPRGILPLEPFLGFVRDRLGAARFGAVPSVFWIGGGSAALHTACALGTVLGLAVALGFLPAGGLAVLWALYLSFVSVGRDFLGFQWDNLLLEAAVVGVLVAPVAWRCRLSRAFTPRPLARWLIWLLLFKLVFSSGVVKLASGDETWRTLDALTFHYETQPLPTPIGWLAHQLPAWVQRASAAMMFAIELLVPFFLLLSMRGRRLAFWLIAGLQAAIAVTGNYAFFNLLTVALALSLLDDSTFPTFVPRATEPPARSWPIWVVAPFALLFALLGTVQMLGMLGLVRSWPSSIVRIYRGVSPFRSVNGYGLFAVMTTSRPEIILEGSADGVTWLPYEFRWKPGDPLRPPQLVAPHQPRLDWQMWFAALGTCEDNPWLASLEQRLLEGSPPVLALLGRNPFPGKPPRFIRANLWNYHFTDVSTLRATGAWWRREPAGSYCPAVSLGN